jgi:hypothetical protein
VAVLCTARDANAERGEASARLFSGNELALLKHPEAAYPAVGSSKVYLPRFGLEIHYGLTNAVLMGVGFDVALARGLSVHDVVFQGFTGELMGDYSDVTLPVSLTYQLNRGTSWRYLIEAAAGAALYRWREDMMLTPDATGRYPIAPGTQWHADLYTSARAGIEFRPGDHWSVSLTGYLGRKGRDMHIGLRLVGSGIMSIGWPQLGF